MEIINDYSQRFLDVIKALNVSDYYIWNNTEGISKGQLSQLRNGRGGASLSMIEALCLKFENINADYIITGRGSMFKSETSEETIQPNNIKILLEEYAKQTQNLLEMRDAKIRELELEIAMLRVQKEIMNAG